MGGVIILTYNWGEPHINVLNESGVCMYVCSYVFLRRTVNIFVFVE